MSGKLTKAEKLAEKDRKAAEKESKRIEKQRKKEEREAERATRKTRVKVEPPPGLDPLSALTKDLRLAALTLGDDEARFLVDSYYNAQDDRIRTAHQVRSLAKSGEPNGVLTFFQQQEQFRELQIAKALDAYSSSRPEGVWARSIVGIGPIIVAGLMANIDINMAPTVGHIWSFAGQNPTAVWAPKTKRPWNGGLKRLCFIIGESFTKTASHPRQTYGSVYSARRKYEVANNDAGYLVDQAKHTLETKNFSRDTEALAWYSGCYPAGTCRAWNDLELAARLTFPDDSGKRQEWLTKARSTYLLNVRVDAGKGLQMLPPARILLRSQRVATKLFLSHYHHVLYEITFKRPPPKPYILDEKTHLAHPEHAVHVHFLGPPNWPMVQGPLPSEENGGLSE